MDKNKDVLSAELRNSVMSTHDSIQYPVDLKVIVLQILPYIIHIILDSKII